MIHVVPMTDELAAGHQGRIQLVNGCPDERDLTRLIEGAVAERGLDPIGMPRLTQLAVISDMDGGDYVRKHSMVPGYRVAAKEGNDDDHGTYKRGHDSTRPGMPSKGIRASCCPQCIAEDLQQFGFSWYRRRHQLVGVDWCITHGCRLSVVDAPRPFVRSPDRWLLENRLTPLQGVAEELLAGGFLRRFADISVMLLERDRPFLLGCIYGTLARRAWELGLRCGRHGKRPCLSDHLSAQVEKAWLVAHVPAWDKKQPFSYFHQIDCVIGLPGRLTVGEAYAMAMAALYETATGAMFDVSSAEALHKYPSSVARLQLPERWSRQLEKACPQYHLQMAAFAKRLGYHASFLHDVFLVLGLPNMRAFEPARSWAALIRFSFFGERFSSACIREQVTEEEVKALLQKCSGNVLSTIRLLRKQYRTRLYAPQGSSPNLVFPPQAA
jgi:hypothetical protein